MLIINDLSKRVAKHKPALLAAAERVLDSGWLVLGNEVRRFEAGFAEYLGLKHCVGVANGTDALELALRAIDVSAGDRVITAANASMYSCCAIIAIGAAPLFSDVEIESASLSVAMLDKLIAGQESSTALDGVKAVVVTHLYGRINPEINEISDWCKSHGIALLEDCAQAHGAALADKNAGTFGEVSTFSFYPTKNLGAIGDGGAVCTDSPIIYERVKRLRQYGWQKKYRVSDAGGRNSRLDELQAAFLNELLPSLNADNKLRLDIAKYYCAEISNMNVKCPQNIASGFVAHLFVITLASSYARDSLAEHLRNNDVASDVHYPVPDHKQLLLSNRYSEIVLPNTELLALTSLTLPMFPEMTIEQQKMVVDAVNNWQE